MATVFKVCLVDFVQRDIHILATEQATTIPSDSTTSQGSQKFSWHVSVDTAALRPAYTPK